jgi:hypothetical protein
MCEIIFIAYNTQPLRAEAPLHAASTPTAEAVLAAVGMTAILANCVRT